MLGAASLDRNTLRPAPSRPAWTLQRNRSWRCCAAILAESGADSGAEGCRGLGQRV